MNTTETNPSTKFLTTFQSKIEEINASGRACFIGITYTAKGTGETARHVLNLGVSYINSLRKAVDELSSVNREGLTGLETEALNNVIDSYKKSIIAQSVGEQNEAYTKKDTYYHICDGLKLNVNDGTFELHAMAVSKVVLIPGTYKTVNSRPLTVAQDKWKKGLAVSNYRSFKLSLEHLDSVRIGGTELEVA